MMIVQDKPNVSHWSLENGYDNDVRDDDYPIRVFNAQHSAILITYPRLSEHDLDFLCRGSFQVRAEVHYKLGHLLLNSRNCYIYNDFSGRAFYISGF